MCRAEVYHCETPVAEPPRPSSPFPRQGRRDRGEPSADGASSVYPPTTSTNTSLSPPPAEKRWSERWKVGPGPRPPITDARRRLRLRRGPAGKAPGWNRCSFSPLANPPTPHPPSVSTSAHFLSSLPLIHTLKRCYGGYIQPTPGSFHQAATNLDTTKS